MNEPVRCHQCGVELPTDAPSGLCPACLLKRGLGSQTADLDRGVPTEADFAPPKPSDLSPLFPDLEILEFIGRGGMGLVYKARQKRLDRLVALKILLPKIARAAAFAERFAREARAMAMLNHPNIVTVHDFGQTAPPAAAGDAGTSSFRTAGGLLARDAAAGLYYFVMEYVDGATLREVMESGKLAPDEAVAIVPQICEALQYAHDNGVVHRDIKPANILLDKRGRLKIADFGLAKLVGRPPHDVGLTDAGQVMGTPHYMAPEQVEHPQDVDHRADIYSLGVVFYQMLTGELPLGRFAPPSKKVSIDVRLDEVVLRSLEREPELRYQHARDVKTEVESIVTTPSQFSQSTGQRDEMIRPVLSERRRRWALIQLLATILVGALLYYSWSTRPDWVTKLALLAAVVVLVGFSVFSLALPLALRITTRLSRESPLGLLRSGARRTDEVIFRFGRILLVSAGFIIAMGVVGFFTLPLYQPAYPWAVLAGIPLAVLIAWGDVFVWATATSAQGKRRRWPDVLLSVVVAVLLAAFLRTFVAEAYVVASESVSPELPLRSRVLTWKLARSFAVGEIILYKDQEGRSLLGRVVRTDASTAAVVVSRNRVGEETVPMARMAGKAVLSGRLLSAAKSPTAETSKGVKTAAGNAELDGK